MASQRPYDFLEWKKRWLSVNGAGNRRPSESELLQKWRAYYRAVEAGTARPIDVSAARPTPGSSGQADGALGPQGPQSDPGRPGATGSASRSGASSSAARAGSARSEGPSGQSDKPGGRTGPPPPSTGVAAADSVFNGAVQQESDLPLSLAQGSSRLSNGQKNEVLVLLNRLYGRRYDTWEDLQKSPGWEGPAVASVIKRVLNLSEIRGTNVDLTRWSYGYEPQRRPAWSGPVRASEAAATTAASLGSADQYLSYVARLATQAGVPWQLAWGVIRARSNWDVGYRSRDGSEVGLAGINVRGASGVSTDEARNPAFAIRWVVQQLASAYQQTGNWALAALSTQDPAAASYARQHGASAPGRARSDQVYLGRVFGGAWASKAGLGDNYVGLYEQLDYGLLENEANTLLEPIFDQTGAGSGREVVSLPDPATLRETATDQFREWFLREPTQQELDRFVAGMTDVVIKSTEKQFAASRPPGTTSNPYDAPSTGGGLIMPVPGGSYSNDWGQGRSGGRRHQGTDIFGPAGTAVKAAVSGIVVKHGDGGVQGHMLSITIRGDDGKSYFYNHLQPGTARVSPGGRVEAGQDIAVIGDSRRTPDGTDLGFAPHLHFSINEGTDNPINPFPLLQGSVDLGSAGGSSAEGQDYAFVEQGDSEQKLLDMLRSSNEYKMLYGHKSEAETEEDYRGRFEGVAQSLLGMNTASATEGIRAGMQSGNDLATQGYIIGREGANTTNKTFRAALFDAAQLIQSVT